jgi:APA family basic amino acid/polyamine antiporter
MSGYPWVPTVFILAAGFVVASSIFSNLFNAMIGAGLILAGIPICLYWKNQKEEPHEV